MNQIIVYSIYLILSFTITLFVGRDLYKNGYLLILDLFEHKEFAQTINKILLIGYYLLNLGYVAITINSFKEIETMNQAVEELSNKLGLILLFLGIMHVNNILTLRSLSKHRNKLIEIFNH